MDRIRWLVVAVAATAGGYVGNKLVGGLYGFPVAAVVAGLATDRLFHSELAAAALVLIGGMVALFQLVGINGPETSTSSVKKAAGAVVAEAKAPTASTSAAATPTRTLRAEPPSADSQASPGDGQREMKAGQVFKDCAVCPDMVAVAPGQFGMGSRPGVADPAAGAEEGPKRMVTVRGFAAGQTAVSRAQFAAFAKASSYVTDAERLGGCFVSAGDQWSFQAQASWRKPGVTQADNHPAVCLTWNDARAYVDWLREQTKQRYRLLSEAEREYAARAGSTDAYWWGDTVTPDQANFNGVGAVSKGARPAAPPKGTVAVKQHAANPFGLYNVHGNVWEWVQDCQHPNYTGAPADGSAWSQDCTGSKRGLRGGSWISPATALRSASRNWLEPDMPANVNGFRVARDAAVVR